MRYFALSVFIAVVLVAIGAGWVLSNNAQERRPVQVLKATGFPEQGVSIVTAQDASFDEWISTALDSDDLKRPDDDVTNNFRVLVVNNGTEPIVGIVLTWNLMLADGRTITHTQSDSNGLRFSATGARPSLAAHSSRVFSLAGPSRNANKGWRTSGSIERERQLSESTAVNVSIDRLCPLFRRHI